jgi:hypothetical protein
MEDCTTLNDKIYIDYFLIETYCADSSHRSNWVKIKEGPHPFVQKMKNELNLIEPG